MAQMSAESAGVIVKQRDLVYERQCFKWWFHEGKINMNIATGTYSFKVKL